MARKVLTDNSLSHIWAALKEKFVAKESGKGLSTNDYTTAEKEKLSGVAANANNYSLPTASNSTLGGVKVGAGLNINNGVLSATGGGTADSVDWSNVQNKPSFFSGSYNDLSNKPSIPTTAADINAIDTSAKGQANGVASLDSTGKVPSTQLPTIPSSAADVGAIASSVKGQPNGVASLDSDGKVPSTQLPSYVDDVIEGYYYNGNFYNTSAHTGTAITGEGSKIYVDLATNISYRFSGSTYVQITSSDIVEITNAEIDAILEA